MQKFWMVYKEDINLQGGLPRHRHSTKAEAVKESERLAIKHPGSLFYVLEVVGASVIVGRAYREIEEKNFNEKWIRGKSSNDIEKKRPDQSGFYDPDFRKGGVYDERM